MGSMNKVLLLGNLGKDCEMRYTPSGAAVANFSIATTEVYTDRQEQRQEKTEWHRIVLWGKAAEAIHSYLVRGKQVLVEGSLQTRSWDDKDGNKKYTTEIKAQRVTLLGGGQKRDEAANGGAQEPYPDTDPDTRPADVADDSDIPF